MCKENQLINLSTFSRPVTPSSTGKKPEDNPSQDSAAHLNSHMKQGSSTDESSSVKIKDNYSLVAGSSKGPAGKQMPHRTSTLNKVNDTPQPDGSNGSVDSNWIEVKRKSKSKGRKYEASGNKENRVKNVGKIHESANCEALRGAPPPRRDFSGNFLQKNTKKN